MSNQGTQLFAIMTNRVSSLVCSQLGESLVKKRHVSSDGIRQVVTRLMSKWKELLKASEDRGKGLGEVKDILEFNEQVDKVLDWIREKVRLTCSFLCLFIGTLNYGY